MATTITWSGNSGKWSDLTQWASGTVPRTGQDVALPAGGYTVTLDSTGAALDVAIAGGATLDLTGSLALAGTLSLASGGVLALSGVLSGGTFTLGGGTLLPAGGTLAGVTVTEGFAALGGLVIDAATVAQSVASGGTVSVSGSLGLAAGTYDNVTFSLDQTHGGITALTAGTGASVTFGANAVVALSQDGSIVSYPLASTNAGLTGGGTMRNLGTITSGIGTPTGAPLQISVARFSNAGEIAIVPLASHEQQIVTIGYGGKFHNVPITGTLDWTQYFAPTLDISSAASFANTGLMTLAGGALLIEAGAFGNSGTISLADVVGQTITTDPSHISSLIGQTLTTSVTVAAGVAQFSNLGTISADRIEFDNSVTLADLGTLHGALVIVGTLDLAGGTLVASLFQGVTIEGTVENGTINPDGATLDISGATLRGIALGAGTVTGAPATIINPPAGSAVTLNAATTKLDLSNGATLDATVTAGSTAASDLIQLANGGTVTFAATTTVTANVPGSTVTITGLDSTLVNNGNIVVDGADLLAGITLDGDGQITLSNGATFSLAGLADTANATITFTSGDITVVLPGTGSLGITLAGLLPGDRIDFANVSAIRSGPFGGTTAATASGGVLFVQGASGDKVNVGLGSIGSDIYFTATADSFGHVLVDVNCFVAGTRIATPFGMAPVETLRPGDPVRLADGAVVPVRWVGRSEIDLARHPQPSRAAPIRIRAGALADGVPSRDLLVSPEHALLLDGALTPALRLANGATIARDDGFTRVSYWHVELDRHGILLAEGAAAESYLDTGNRGRFAGEAGARPLFADFTMAPDPKALAIWEQRGAAPLRLDAPAARARVIARAEALGWRRDADPALALDCGGAKLPLTMTPQGVRAVLPAGARAVRLVSRSIVPAETIAGSGDTRRLGVAVRAALLAGWTLHADAMADGWHAADPAEDWRWTRGDARLRFPRLVKPTALDLHLAPAALYWRPPAASSGATVGAERPWWPMAQT